MGQLDEPGQEPINETKPTKRCWETGASGAQRVAGGVRSSDTWEVAWDVVEDELLGMTLETGQCHCKIHCAWGRNSNGDVPENVVENCWRQPRWLWSLLGFSLAGFFGWPWWRHCRRLLEEGSRHFRWLSCVGVGLVGETKMLVKPSEGVCSSLKAVQLGVSRRWPR